jgi:putative SOS response-associated peptidase YedK
MKPDYSGPAAIPAPGGTDKIFPIRFLCTVFMCGKFTAMASWAEMTQPPPAGGDGGEDWPVSFRVTDVLPVIIFDSRARTRRIVPMRWGFPAPGDWRRPQPIHARAERIDVTPAFAQAFRDGQRGIVLVHTFNEAPDSGEQHTIDPGGALGLAFVWRRFEVGAAIPLTACVMVTVPANRLLSGLPTDRMPAILAAEDWPAWLGETAATPAQAKTCLKTVEGVRWTMTREERAARRPRRKPTMADPGGLF